MPSDLLKSVDRYARVSEPCQCCVPQIVPPQVLEAELSHDFVPVGRVAKNRRRYAPAARSPKQASIRITTCDHNPPLDERWPAETLVEPALTPRPTALRQATRLALRHGLP